MIVFQAESIARGVEEAANVDTRLGGGGVGGGGAGGAGGVQEELREVERSIQELEGG